MESLRTESEKSGVAGPTWRTVVNPAKDLPEQKSLTLVILPPSLAWDESSRGTSAVHEYVLTISKRCGRRDRIFRNTLLFLAGTTRGLAALRLAFQERAALIAVRADYWDQLDKSQRDDLRNRIDVANRAAQRALGQAYTVVLRGRGKEVESVLLANARKSFREHLGYVWTALVEDEEWILRRVGSVTLANTGLIPTEGSLRLKDAIEAYLRFTDKPMIATRGAVTAGLTQACADGLVGIGRGANLSTLQVRYCKQSISLDPNEDGLWIIPPFDPRPAVAQSGKEVARGSNGRTETTAVSRSRQIETVETIGSAGTVRSFVIRGEVPVESWAELFRCFIAPAARMELKRLGLGVEFDFVLPEGAAMHENDSALTAMKEAARQLGLTITIR